MGGEPSPKLTDAELDQLARQLFAEVRAEHREDEDPARDRAGGDIEAERAMESVDWLLGGDGDDAAGDGGGD